MPRYHYECTDGHHLDLWATIEEMEEFEQGQPMCECGKALVRDLRTRRHLTFHDGFYEHISEKGEHISNMSDLKRIAEENEQYSQYAEDFGGVFKTRGRRWV